MTCHGPIHGRDKRFVSSAKCLDGDRARPSSCSVGTGPESNYLGHPLPRLRTSGNVPPLSYTLSWLAKEHLYLYFLSFR